MPRVVTRTAPAALAACALLAGCDAGAPGGGGGAVLSGIGGPRCGDARAFAASLRDNLSVEANATFSPDNDPLGDALRIEVTGLELANTVELGRRGGLVACRTTATYGYTVTPTRVFTMPRGSVRGQVVDRADDSHVTLLDDPAVKGVVDACRAATRPGPRDCGNIEPSSLAYVMCRENQPDQSCALVAERQAVAPVSRVVVAPQSLDVAFVLGRSEDGRVRVLEGLEYQLDDMFIASRFGSGSLTITERCRITNPGDDNEAPFAREVPCPAGLDPILRRSDSGYLPLPEELKRRRRARPVSPGR